MAILRYKGFYGTSDETLEAEKVSFYGKLLIKERNIIYSVDSKQWLQKAFENAVDDFLLRQEL